MDFSAGVMLILGLLLGGGAGAAAAWFVLRQKLTTTRAEDAAGAERARAEVSEARREAAAAREDAAHARTESASLRTAMAESRAESWEAQSDQAEVRVALASAQAKLTAAQERAADAEARADKIAEDREVLANQFKVLSEAALEAQGRKAEETAEARYVRTQQLMTPVNESLRQLQERLTAVEKDRVSLATDLRNQVQAVQSTGEHLRRETHALVTALRKPQVRGNWGELQLKNAAELANMRQHCDFDLQHSTTTTGGNGIRPDMRVNLSDGKYVFVDAKVPLESFLDAHDTDDEHQREAALDRFGKVVRGHVDQLSGKQYWAIEDHTPEFVIMFLPSEALAAEALSRMPDLHEHAFRKNIVIASPSTLIAMLRTVAYSWKQAALAANAKEVSDLGRELHQRLSTMGNHFDKLGRSLHTAVKSYNSTLGSLESRVFVTARRLNDLDVTTDELATSEIIDTQPRQVTAEELVEDATQATPMIGRERASVARAEPAETEAEPAEAALPEADQLTRSDPDLFELTGGEAPRRVPRRRSS